MAECRRFVGLDVHRETSIACWLEPSTGLTAEASFAHDQRGLRRLASWARQAASGEVLACHEAGQWGFEPQRRPDRASPRVTRDLARRREGAPAASIARANKAQRGLYAKQKRLVERGKHPHLAAVAAARELLGYVWAELRTWPAATQETPS